MWLGAGRGAGRAVVALLGVGLGAALTVSSTAGQGATSDPCEWGHTVVNVGGAPCRCGSRGCLEAYVGAEAILAGYAARRASRPLREPDVEAQLAELVRRASRPGAAADVLAETAEYLGIGIANLVNLLRPDRVVLSGWAGDLLGPAILDGVRDAAARHALPYMYGDIRIELGQLGSQAVAMGAATLPVMQILALGDRPAVPVR
jgi:predicted NBD/HSP70 family sugar kinase